MSLIYLLSCFLAVVTRCYTETPGRGCDEILTSLNGTITNPTSPQRQTDSSVYSCKWSIELKETTQPRHVELRFTKFNFTGVMPECSDGDYVELFIGCNNFKPVGKFCGRTSLPVIYSSDHCLQIVFHSFGIFVSSPRSQFKAVYSQRLLSRAVSQNYFGCGNEHHVNVNKGNIFSPHWPLPYPQYVDCVWHVTTRPGLHVKLLFFDFDVRMTDACAEADFVEVKTGAEFSRGKSVMKYKECGTKSPFALTIVGGSIFIQFKSDAVTGNRGFMAGFVAYSVEESSFSPHVLIMLGVIFLALFALAGKALLQKLIERSKLTRKPIFHRLRRRFHNAGISPIVASHWGESDEPDRSFEGAPCENPSAESVTKEDRLPRKSSLKTVTFESVTARGNNTGQMI